MIISGRWPGSFLSFKMRLFTVPCLHPVCACRIFVFYAGAVFFFLSIWLFHGFKTNQLKLCCAFLVLMLFSGIIHVVDWVCRRFNVCVVVGFRIPLREQIGPVLTPTQMTPRMCLLSAPTIDLLYTCCLQVVIREANCFGLGNPCFSAVNARNLCVFLVGGSKA